ncbi:zf-HC2 domain-containing protein [Massilia sp. S19_KUP03_FR1]|uniref:zf-HC2 domain-containing protein n=1 Tax=Massilia sp. S19_KUP03_FR1 TaxID=3025503 RepID=UPI002FCDA581
MKPHDSDAAGLTHAAHHEAQSVLPWLANGSLGGAELERVQAHLHGCAACRTDLAQLHTLRAAEPALLPGLDVDAALARLLPQLDQADAPPRQGADLPVQRGWLAANDRSWLRAAVALQCGAIVVLAVLLWRPAAAPDADYRVLGASPGVQGSLIVTFKPDTPERELRRIVRASGAHISGGPTATGAWLLATAEAPAATATRLRAEAAVTLAEPLGTEGQP